MSNEENKQQILGHAQGIPRDSKAAEDIFPKREPIIPVENVKFRNHSIRLDVIEKRLSNIEQTLGRLVVQCESAKLLTPLIPVPKESMTAIDHNLFKLYGENIHLKEEINQLMIAIKEWKSKNKELNNTIEAKNIHIKALLLEIAQINKLIEDKNELQS